VINSNKLKLIFIHSVSPLFLGGSIYVLFRSPSLRMFEWITKMGLDNLVHCAREILNPIKGNLPYWAYYSLPDGLWVYAFTSALLIFWNGHLTLWLIFPFILGVFCEVAQGLEILFGTFDIIDLFFNFIAMIISFLIIKVKQNEQTIS